MDYQLDDGTVLRNVHDVSQCEGRGCSIHHPSNHHMRTWPMVWRNWHGYFERTCPHGVGHPDPDDMAFHASIGDDAAGVHCCDGCCVAPIFRYKTADNKMSKAVYKALIYVMAVIKRRRWLIIVRSLDG